MAILVTLVTTAATGHTTREPSAPLPGLTTDAAAVQAQLAGIPQRGLMLGAATAPVTVVVYADLICQPCATAAATLLTPLIADYVKPGFVRVELEPIAQSEQSSQFAYGAYSAGMQGKGWDYALLAYAATTPRSVGPQSSPVALARALGLNRRRWRASLFSQRWANLLEQALAVAAVGKFTNFPVLGVHGPSGARPSVTVLRPPMTFSELASAISAADSASN
ncbi:MAG: thioredoxin domain-containing protein [Solirubrobacteraceae bacterium]